MNLLNLTFGLHNQCIEPISTGMLLQLKPPSQISPASEVYLNFFLVCVASKLDSKQIVSSNSHTVLSAVLSIIRSGLDIVIATWGERSSSYGMVSQVRLDGDVVWKTLLKTLCHMGQHRVMSLCEPNCFSQERRAVVELVVEGGLGRRSIWLLAHQAVITSLSSSVEQIDGLCLFAFLGQQKFLGTDLYQSRFMCF